MTGRIIRGVGGFYYVHGEDGGIYACRAKGIFRKTGEKPLVGDRVEISVVHEKDMEGNVDGILPRTNALVRPAVANVDQVFLMFACASPAPNFGLLDRFLLMAGAAGLPTVIVFNKADLVGEREMAEVMEIYGKCGCPVYFISTKAPDRQGGLDAAGTGSRSGQMAALRSLLPGKTTVLAGPSGVGKSSFTNLVAPDAGMEIGKLSAKIDRGKHTTRHTELFALPGGGFLMDTPGFATLNLAGADATWLKGQFPEFAQYEAGCKFAGCAHIGEGECGVKAAVESGGINPRRYESYAAFYKEIKDMRRY
ncbi:MAG: ribosome small subunit-dependent GTPase A [Lachnospiraceae bacterium]|jgi:ribosome biogenesis GTPase|nr:ribosome small subunit-dependent GTPase A [Lachnospiraceae bacterium]